jgi:superfamily II RNA helicase
VPAVPTVPPLVAHLPADESDGALLDGFLAFVEQRGLTLYPAQEEAVLEVFAGNNVILDTPTGSGKSMVALAGHFAALARGQRGYYTAPVKALVSEKFFALCADLGSQRVGMLTGDAAVNPTAPVICCTAEVLANIALRDGEDAAVDHVCMDEFHYYADPDRGWAWQVPLLELPQATFLLMSATLGPMDFFSQELTRRTGRPTALVRSTERPVPLEVEYRETPLHETLTELVERGRAPVYVVHFTQKEATQAAQSLTSLDVLDAAGKAAVRQAVGDFRFDSPFGNDLRRFVAAGIGVHHAGMLPRYRLLVEKLAQQGLLKLICGTDTLGVGVNVPIRTVLFTQLHKFDGRRVRTLSVREFLQIAGRAGRKGFDDIGYVWVQAPPHVVENKRASERVAHDPSRRRKLVRKRPPERGYAHWDEGTMQRLVTGQPERLESSFAVSHAMLLQLLDRPGDGCAATRELLVANHEPRARQRRHIRRAISVYRTLVGAGLVEQLDRPDSEGRTARVNLDLQAEFALTQPLSPFVVDAVDLLDRSGEDYELDVLSVVEAVLEDPMPVLLAQLDRLKGQVVAQLKREGVAYEERMEELSDLTWPQPLGEWLEQTFHLWRVHHPWVVDEAPSPKSVARELWEAAMTFREYVNHYGLRRSEGVLLRYLSDAYKGLVQNVPEAAKTEGVHDLTEWLGALVRSVDSSLLDEWERLRHPDPAAAPEVRARVDPTTTHGFAVMVRNEAFRWATLVARRDWAALAEVGRPGGGRWRPSELEAELAPYFAEHTEVILDADARAATHLIVARHGDRWEVTQILADPLHSGEWRLHGVVDLDASREANGPVLALSGVERL